MKLGGGKAGLGGASAACGCPGGSEGPLREEGILATVGSRSRPFCRQWVMWASQWLLVNYVK